MKDFIKILEELIIKKIAMGYYKFISLAIRLLIFTSTLNKENNKTLSSYMFKHLQKIKLVGRTKLCSFLASKLTIMNCCSCGTFFNSKQPKLFMCSDLREILSSLSHFNLMRDIKIGDPMVFGVWQTVSMLDFPFSLKTCSNVQNLLVYCHVKFVFYFFTRWSDNAGKRF